MISFKQFLQAIDEGASDQLAAIQKQLTDIDLRMKPFMDRKLRLQMMISQLQKQAAAEQNKMTQQNQRTQQNQQMALQAQQQAQQAAVAPNV